MSKTMLAVFAALALVGCGRGDKREVASADSLNRDLQLAPVDTTAPLNDTALQPAPAPRQPAPAPNGRTGDAGSEAEGQSRRPSRRPGSAVAGRRLRPRLRRPLRLRLRRPGPSRWRRARRSPRRPMRRFAPTRTRWVMK